MIATLDVGEMAEACVVAGLRKLGFTIVPPGARGPGATVLEAWKVRQRVVVHVNATVSPAAPRSLTIEEEQTLRHRAAKADGHAWEARVLLDSDLELVQLDWQPLE